MTEKELEQLFRKKFDERNVEFNPAAWKGAERLIIAGERRKRRRTIMAWSTAAVFIGFGAVSLWSGFNTPMYTPSNEQIIAWPSNSEGNEVDASSIAIEDAANANNLGINGPSSSEGATSLQSQNDELNNVTESSSEAAAGIVASVDSDRSYADQGIGNSYNASVDEESAEPVTSNPREEQETTQLSEVVLVQSAQIAESEESGSSDVSNRSVETITSSEAAIIAADYASEETADTEEKIEVAEESTTSESSDAVIERPRHRVQQWNVGFDAGAQAAQVTEGNLGWTPAFYGGLSVEFAFAENLALRSGLMYSQRSSSGAEIKETSFDYGFGSRYIERTSVSRSTSFLELPISLQFAVESHEFELGGYVGYKLLEVGATESSIVETNNGTQTEEYRSVITEGGADNWDYGLQLGYAYRVNENWRITAQALMGLDDNFSTQAESMNRHLQLRLGVRYMLGL